MNTKRLLLVFIVLITAILVMSGCKSYVDTGAKATQDASVSKTVAARPTQTPLIIIKEVVVTPTPIPTSIVKIVSTEILKDTIAPGENSEVVSTYEMGKADLQQKVDEFTTGTWKVTTYQGVTEQMNGWFKNLKDPKPESWPVFPNVDNSLVDFQAKNGLEYGLDERNYCPQETCDVIVAAGEYNGITADYDFGFLECVATETVGCGIMFVNVGDVSANFEQVVVNNGFSVTGRYWNGDELHQAIWGFVSHASANMLNMPTTLNPEGSSNAGANCSVREGCKSVLWRVVITSGNQVLTIGETTVNPTK